jgi:hypothetical protein
MGGLGSDNRYRFSKKTITEQCHSLDVRDFYREGLLKPGTCFRCSWSRAEKEMASIRGFVYQDRMNLSYRHRSGLGSEWEDVKEPVSLGRGRSATSGESVPGSSAQVLGAAGGWQSSTGGGSTSCAGIAMTSATRASVRTRTTGP